ncbi:alpha-N-acetylglucosaminidase TIM-barrel domain-containing protein [Nocardiopsis sp. NPDC058789]|uniref:alpha-N-acetylglucosaminidase TIM-barrel domain-containing protein n=1 Tax=Nocardiopsis sp. NPDC058789 TaxID=3346634 RepID=UPI00366FB401
MSAIATDPPIWDSVVTGLVTRILGRGHPDVHFLSLDARERSFEFGAEAGVLTVAATDALAAAVGVHTYLRTVCAVAVGWDTPRPLPVTEFPDAPPTRGTAETEHLYYLNFCTQGYTSAYWGWDDWERETDWMALHGVTMPLTLLGHEAVLREALTGLGLDESTVLRFLGGPGYLPWQYMGNLDGFPDPMPSSWIDAHLDLARRVLERQRSFGMTPVLPGFTGHVPAELAPGRTRTRDWQGFRTHVLDPADPLYARAAEEVAGVQARLLGTDHLYAIDPFIEMVPVDADPAFPGAVARATLDGLTGADPDAVWVLQAWPFSYQRDFWSDSRVNAFLDAIPDDRVLVLDLWAEEDPQWSRLDSFGTKAWIWCALLNFGGRTDPIGDLQGAVDGINAAKATGNRPVGLGLAMEGTRNNPAFFHLVADQAWTRTEDVRRDWLPGFVRGRYGADADPALLAAWRGLNATVYGASDVRIFPEQFNGVLTARPGYADLAFPDRVRTDAAGLVWYDWADLVGAWEALVGAAERHPALADGPLGGDLVDVAMAVLSRVCDHRYAELVEAAAGRGEVPEEGVARFLRVFDDLDALLATRPEYRYATWEARAEAWATDDDERRVLRDNARRILTVWTTTEDTVLDDYAARLWSGLVGGYHRPRWAAWSRGLPRALSDRSAASAELDRELTGIAERFLAEGAPPVPVPQEGVVARSRLLLDRYGRADAP